MWKIILLIILAEVWNTAGHIFFKKSANRFGTHDFGSFKGWLKFMGDVYSSPLIWLGFVSMVAGMAIWVLALANADLSFVFPMGSLQYIFIIFASYIFLGEKIDRMKFVGTLLVVLGIVLIGVS
jgi:drug/metabolite transporter (DMT)-like permease